MARRSLKPQLNQIRAWVHQGRTDAWIAHQLEISATELREFRKQYDLSPDDENAGSSEIDLRDEIEAEIEAATEPRRPKRPRRRARPTRTTRSDEERGEDAEGGAGAARRRRRRAAAAAAAAAAKSSRRPSTTARPTATASGSTPRSRTTPSTPSTGPASATSPSASRPTRSSSAAPARAATARTPTSRRVRRRRDSDSDRVRSDRQLAAAGEVGGAPQVEPEGGVGERLRVAVDRRGDVDRDLLGTSRCPRP